MTTKTKAMRAWAVRHLGYWLVCPTFTLANIEAKRFGGKVIRVEIREVKKDKGDVG